LTGSENLPAEETSFVNTSYGRKLDINEAEKLKLVSSLTLREKDTYLLLLEGYTLKETAGQLSIKYSTANTHQTAIYKKLRVNSRAELIINYRGMGITEEKIGL